MNIWEEYKEDLKNCLRVRLLLVNKEINRFHDYLRTNNVKEISAEGAMIRTRQIVRLTEEFSNLIAKDTQIAFIWKERGEWYWHGTVGTTMGAAVEEGLSLTEVIAKLKDLGYTQFRIELND